MADQNPDGKCSWKLAWIPLMIVAGVLGICWGFYHVVGEPAADELAKRLEPTWLPLQFQTGLGGGSLTKRLSELNDELVKATGYHLLVVKIFMKYQYFSLLASLISGALTAAFGFPIAVDGWKTPNNCLRVAFVTSAALLALFVAIPKTFKYDENISNNSNLYQAYVVLAGKLRTGVVAPDVTVARASTSSTSRTTVPTKGAATGEMNESELRALARSIESDLAKLKSLSLAFDSINAPVLSINMPGKQQ